MPRWGNKCLGGTDNREVKWANSPLHKGDRGGSSDRRLLAELYISLEAQCES